MGSDTTVAFTTPASNTKVYRETTGSADVQYVRRHTATANTPATWALSLTASQVVAADEQRVTLAFTHCGTTGVIYLAPGGNTPTVSSFLIQLNPGETFIVEDGDVELRWDAVATAAVGNLLAWRGTAA